MKNRSTILITGAAQGIGLTTAFVLAQKGYHVYAMVRKSSDTTQLDAYLNQYPNLTKVIGDVCHEADMENIVSDIINEQQRLDVLINNACHVLTGTSESCTIDEQKQSMDVNYFGVIRAQNAVLPHMRQNKSGHIINISSVSGYEPFPHLETYVASKFALEGMTESLALHAAFWNINVSLIEPVGVKTMAPALAPMGTRPIKDTDAYDRMLKRAKKQMQDSYEQSLDRDVIALKIVEVIESEKPELHYPVGQYAQDAIEKRFCDPSGQSMLASKQALLEKMGLFPLK